MSTDIPESATIFAAVAASLFTAVGVLGNLLTIVALLRIPKLRAQVTTIFILSLAISDFLHCSIAMPMNVSRFVHRKWKLGYESWTCNFFPLIFYGTIIVSLVNMAAIALNRLVSIGFQSYYKQIFTYTNTSIIIMFVWLFGILMQILPLAGGTYIQYGRVAILSISFTKWAFLETICPFFKDFFWSLFP